MRCRGYKESGEDAENYKLRSFIEYYYGDNIKDVLHEACNTHERHEQWAAYLQNYIQLVGKNEVQVLLVVAHFPSLKAIRRAIFV
jgi:hypothetical protein